MIKSIGITALARSVEELEALVKLLETLGIRKDLKGGEEGFRYVEFCPGTINLHVALGKRPGNNPDLWLQVSHPDTAFEIVKKGGFDPRDFSDPKMSGPMRYFDVELPGGTLVRIGGFSHPLLTDIKPVPHIQGGLSAQGKKFCVVVSTFNSFITERLLAGAVDVLLRCGAETPMVVRVPGAFEIPSAARILAQSKEYDAIICLGCLLRGDTAHYDVIVNEVTRGIGQSAQETGVPHAFGVLTCETLEQAIDRAGLKMGNKGAEAAFAAIEMASLTKFVRTTLFRRRAPGIRKAASARLVSDGGKKQVPRSARNDKVTARNDKVTARNDKLKGRSQRHKRASAKTKQRRK
ncbi:MAG: 6,7-dimethyl-8-ribityllumazine synthase [Candidatus Sulfotelmatobacter sp.]